MSEMMNALVKSAAAPGLELKQVPVPQVGYNDVKIKIHYTSICGTDLHIYNWDPWSQETVKPPITIGHEYVGEIVEMGDGVKGYTIGEIVSGEGHITCGTCRNCREGKAHLCKETVGVGVNRDGAFAEYLVIPQSNVVKVDPAIPEQLCSSFDPLGNAVHTALQYDVVGEDVLITGAGPIGIMAAAICRHNGARNVFITDINEYRLNLAKEIADVTPINVKTMDLDAEMKKHGIKEGFDVGLEMSGNNGALVQMIDHMYNGGRIAVLGLRGGNMEIPWNKVVTHCLEFRGVYGRKVFETWHKMIAMVTSGLHIEKILTHQFDYRDFEKGFAVMNSGKCGKVVLDWTGKTQREA